MKRFIFIFHFSFLVFHFSFGQQYGWKNLSGNLPDFPFDTIYNGSGDTIVAGLMDLSFISDNEGWIVTSNGNNQGGGAILHTMDGGETWLVSSVNTSCLAILMLNQTTGYAAGSSGIIWKTTDGGQTWNFHGTIATTCTDIEFPPQPADTGYACGMDGQVCMITPDGITMLESNIVGAVQTLSFPETKDEGWFEGEGWGMIRHYADGQWKSDQIGISGYHNSIDFIDNQNGWTVGDRILHTTNGYEWVEQMNHPVLESALLDVCFININEGWAVGATGQVLKTADGGSLWENDPPVTNELLTAVQFTSAINGFIIGNNKTIYRYTLISGEEETGRPGDREMELVKVWPNPTRGEFKVQRSKGKVELESLELIDSYGKRLELWNPGTIGTYETSGTSGTSGTFGTSGTSGTRNQEPGTWNHELDISPLPSGIYFIRISLENQMIVKKIIKI